MRIVTTENLYSKYNKVQADIEELIKPLNAQIDVLPANSTCTFIKVHVDAITDDVLLLGGNSIVPFWQVQNPTNDSDQSILSDSPYQCIKDSLYYVPDHVVTRIPDEEGPNAKFDYLQTVIQNQANYLVNKSTNNGFINYTASVWQGISNYMRSEFSMSAQSLCPPVIVSNLNPATINGKKFAYLNLHSGHGLASFYGQNGAIYPVALNPTPGFFKDTLVFSEACFGGEITGRDRSNSICLQALFSSCIGFIGSTCTAYGPASAPADGADLLFECFMKRILSGESFGQGLLNGKVDFATQTMKNLGNVEPSNKKTLLQFYGLGLPGVIL